MLPKKNRANKKEIEEIFKNGKTIYSDNLLLKYTNKPGFLKKISFIAPKTASKKAVDRSLLKRRGYVVLERFFDTIPNSFCCAVVFGKKSKQFFGGRKNKKHNPIQNLENELKKVINKIN